MGTAGYQPAGRRISSSSDPRKVIESAGSRSPKFDMGDSVESTSGYGSGLVTALQSVIFGFAIVVVPILVTAVVSTTLIDQDFHFGQTVVTAMGLWALSHGASTSISGAAITIVPLGITLALIVAAYVSVRRSMLFESKAIGAYVGSYVAFGLVLGVVTKSGAAITVRSMLTTLCVSVVSLALARRKRVDSGGMNAFWGALTRRLPRWVMNAGVGSLAACGVLTAIAGLTTLMWFYLGKDSMFLVLQGWSLDALSGFALGVAQLAFLPNLMLWAVGWLSGAGFSIGVDTIVSPTQVVLGPLPNLPLLGAIPQAAAPSVFVYAFLALIACAGVVGALLVSRRDDRYSWWMFFTVPAVVVLGTVGLLSFALWLSGGEIGAGPDTWFGVPVFSCAWRMAVVLFVACLATISLARPELRGWVVGKVRKSSSASYSEMMSSEPLSPPASGLASAAVPPVAQGDAAGSNAPFAGAAKVTRVAGASAASSLRDAAPSSHSSADARTNLPAGSSKSAVSSRSTVSPKSTVSSKSALTSKSAVSTGSSMSTSSAVSWKSTASSLSTRSSISPRSALSVSSPDDE